MAEPLLCVRDLDVWYGRPPAGVQALDRFSLDLAEGEIVGLVGESGSGKSTALMAMLRVLGPPAVITGGSVRFGGREVLSMGEEALRSWRWSEVSLVPQSALNALNPVLTVGQQFADTLRAHGVSDRAEVGRRASALLRLVDLDPVHLDAYAHTLSGGMRQRVALALALALRPRLVFLDEPTTALDVVVEREILQRLVHLQREPGLWGALHHPRSQPPAGGRGPGRRLVLRPAGRARTRGGPASRWAPSLQPGAAARDAAGLWGGRAGLHSGCAASAVGPPLRGAASTLAARWRRGCAPPSVQPPPRSLTGTRRRVTTSTGRHGEPPAAGGARPRGPVPRGGWAAASLALGRPGGLVLGAQGRDPALVGESGSGKSTLARAIARLVQPCSGQLLLDGTDMLTKEPRQASKAYRQRVQAGVPGPLRQPQSGPHDPARGRPAPASPRTGHASRGARQEPRLARGLWPAARGPLPGPTSPQPLGGSASGWPSHVPSPRTPMCCWPMSRPACSTSAFARMSCACLAPAGRAGTREVLVTHDLAAARFVADRILVLYGGMMMELSDAETLLSAPLHPYAQLLMAAVPRAGGALFAPLPAAPGSADVVDPGPGCPFAARCPEAHDRCRSETPPVHAVGERLVRCHLHEPAAGAGPG